MYVQVFQCQRRILNHHLNVSVEAYDSAIFQRLRSLVTCVVIFDLMDIYGRLANLNRRSAVTYAARVGGYAITPLVFVV